MDIGIGLSTEKDPILAAKEASGTARINLSPSSKIDLAIVFSSIDLACPTLLKTIGGFLGGAPLIGCSGAAIISDKGIFKHGLVILLLTFPPGLYFNVAVTKEIRTRTPVISGEELGEKLLYGSRDTRRDLSVVFSDGLIDDGSGFIYGLQERLGKSFPLIGGSASDNLRFFRTYLYFNREVLTDAAVGVLLGGGKLNFGMGIKHGWKPLGKPRQVTLSQGNAVFEIDGLPAVKLYEEYLAQNTAELKKNLKHISILYPLGIYLSGEDEYLLRNLVSIENNGALRFQGDIPQDSQVRLMIGTKESCLNATHQAAEEAKTGLFGPAFNITKKGTKYFVLVFDSISRHMLLRREAYKELEIIKEKFGQDTPIIGLCTYGEQAPLKAINYRGRAYFHNQTITILAIGG